MHNPFLKNIVAERSDLVSTFRQRYIEEFENLNNSPKPHTIQHPAG